MRSYFYAGVFKPIVRIDSHLYAFDKLAHFQEVYLRNYLEVKKKCREL